MRVGTEARSMLNSNVDEITAADIDALVQAQHIDRVLRRVEGDAAARTA
jgi:hypothetical protein